MHVISQRVDVWEAERTLRAEHDRGLSQHCAADGRRIPTQMDRLLVFALCLGVVEMDRTEAAQPARLGQRQTVDGRRRGPLTAAQRPRRRDRRRAGCRVVLHPLMMLQLADRGERQSAHGAREEIVGRPRVRGADVRRQGSHRVEVLTLTVRTLEKNDAVECVL